MKKWFAILLALTMVVSLTACKKNADSTPPGTTENSQPTTESTAPSTEITEPSSEATEPSSEVTEPSSEVTEPSSEVTEPTEDAAEPTVEWIDGNEYYYRPDGSLLCTKIYDDSGKLTERVAYQDDDQILRWEYEYDAEGLVSCVRVYNRNNCLSQIWQNSTGALVTEITGQGCTDTLYGDDIQKKWVYDEDWNLLEESYYRDNQPGWALSYIYDKNGYIISTIRYDAGEEASRTEHIRGENGALLQEDYYYRGNQQYSFQYSETCTVKVHYENNAPFWRAAYNNEEDISDVDFFNAQGQVIQSIHYEDYQEKWCRTFTYDENGNLVNEVLQEVGENESVDRTLYHYDGNTVSGYTGHDGWNYEAEYDEQGRLLWENTACDYEYDENNYIEYKYNPDGSYTSTWVGATCGRFYSHYDSNGNLLEYYGGDDPGDNPDPSQMSQWNRYEYNEYGDVIRSEYYCFGELICTYRYEYNYDEDGNWTERVCYADGEEFSRWSHTYSFDANGNLIELREETPSQIRVYSYSYDETGRITQEIKRCFDK